MSAPSENHVPRDGDASTMGEAFLAALLKESRSFTRVSLRDADESDATPIVRPPRTEAEIPDRMGRYTVVGEIARGGMGQVLKARDGDIGRDIALKALLEDHRSNPETVRRFFEEAQICGQMQHPGIVPIHEASCSDGERPYFTMKLVKGRTLAALLDEARDLADRRRQFMAVFLQVCRTVGYAHARRVIHRDLKPANIMVGAFGEVLVMDWGLAKVFTERGEAPAALSQVSVIETIRSGNGSDSLAGSVFGTPAYMSPEQARGAIDEVDERSDVFGLGAILCEIMTGRPPYTGQTAADIFRQARKGYLEEAFALLDGCGADPALVALAKRCLAFEPRERLADAGAVAREVEEHLRTLEERARSAAREAAEARARSIQVRRLRKLTIALAATVLLGLGAAGGMRLRLERRETERSAEISRAVHEAMVEASELRASSSGSQLAGLESALSAAQRAEGRAQESADRSLAARAGELRSTIEADIGRVREARARERRNRHAVERLAEIRSAQEERPQSAGLAYRQVFQELGIDAENLSEDEAVRLVRESGIPVDLALALDAWAAWSKGFYGKDSKVWRLLLRVARAADADPWRIRLRAAVEDDDGIGILKLAAELRPEEASPATRVFLARNLAARGEVSQAAAMLREAQRRYPSDAQVQAALGDLRSQQVALALTPESSAAHQELAHWWWRRDRTDLHLAHAREAVRLNPASPNAHNLLGIALYRRKDNENARKAYEKTIELDPLNAPAYNNLANIFMASPDLSAAIDLYRKAIRIAPDRINWNNLGNALEEMKDPSGAVAAWEEAIRFGFNPPERNVKIARTLWRELKDAAGAAYHYREASRLAPEWTVPPVELAQVLAEERKLAESLAAFDEAFALGPRDAWVHTRFVETAGRWEPPPRDGAMAKAAADAVATLGRVRASLRNPPAQSERSYLLALALLAESGDAERARELEERSAAPQWRRDPDLLPLLARIQRAAGRLGEAIISLEEALLMPGAPTTLDLQVQEYRAAALPDLVSYASIDAALEDDVLVPAGVVWRYQPARENPSEGLDWTELGFDDSSWREGPSGIGYGDGDDATLLPDMRNSYSSVYLRRTFYLPDPKALKSVTLSVRVDDGFIAYVNGKEIGRHNAPGRPGDRAWFDALAPSSVDNARDAPPISIDAASLEAGENVLAIHGFNSALGSSDLTLIPVLRAATAFAPGGAGERIEAFRAAATGPDAAARLEYLEGRLLERSGKDAEALERLGRAAELERGRPEPHLRLAERLRAMGNAAAAEEHLRTFFVARGAADERLLDRWLDLCLDDLHLSWPDIDRRLDRGVAYPETGTAGWRVWAVRTLVAQGILRIRCGGERHRSPDGTEWAADRFFIEGSANRLRADVSGTQDDELYMTERYFRTPVGLPAPAYRIPLPPGFYRVTVHLAETYDRYREGGNRVFDVALEDVPVLREYDAVAAVGWGTADRRSFPARVRDAYLELSLTPHQGDPRLSAIEIEAIDFSAYRALTERHVVETKRWSPALGQLGEALLVAGERAAAVAVLEEAAGFDASVPYHRQLLEDTRAALLPDLATLDSIDAAFDAAADGDGLKLLESLRAAAKGDDAAARMAYLEGRILRQQDKAEDALARFRAAMAAGPLAAYRAAECLRQLGRGAEAVEVLIPSFAGRRVGAPAFSLWWDICAGDLGRDPWDALRSLPACDPPDTIAIVATSEEAGQEWRYTTSEPQPTWMEPAFDDSGWSRGPGGLGGRGSGQPRALTVRTTWETPDIWARRTARLDRRPRLNPCLRYFHDDEAEVFLNGRQIARLPAWTDSYAIQPLVRDDLAREGDNLLAVNCHQQVGEQGIDVGIVEGVGAAYRTLRELVTVGAVRIRCGGSAHTSPAGIVWGADRFYVGGTIAAFRTDELPSDMRRTAEDPLYRKFRWFGRRSLPDRGYHVPLPPGRYRVSLHFAEVDSALMGIGARVFGVRIEGALVLEHYDVARDVGPGAAAVKTFDSTVSDGRLDIEFVAEVREPMISAIEIVPAP